METMALDERVERLRTFVGNGVFKTLDPEEQGLMLQQLGCMMGYSATLRDRIAFWKKPPP
jgi:hypothetical protein